MKRLFRNSHGFTVIELMAVVVIIGVIAAIAYPRLENLPETRAKFAVEKMRSDFRYAQQLAMTTQRQTRVIAVPGSNLYILQIESAPGSGIFNNLQHPSEGGNFWVFFNTGQYEDVTISSVSDGVFGGVLLAVVFDAYGAPHWFDGSDLTAGNHVVLNSSYTLQLRPETGYMVVS